MMNAFNTFTSLTVPTRRAYTLAPLATLAPLVSFLIQFNWLTQ